MDIYSFINWFLCIVSLDIYWNVSFSVLNISGLWWTVALAMAPFASYMGLVPWERVCF